MKKLIDEFISDRKVAIVGVSPRKENWGKALMKEFTKHNYTVIPVNPKYDVIEGQKCYPSVMDLPEGIENVILAVNADLADEIAVQFKGTSIKRVWFQRGVGKGSYSDSAGKILKDEGIGIIYGFCPMMFIGDGFHKFHYWMRRTLGKTPQEFSMN